MPKKKKNQHFKELGALIEAWRQEKFRSALALFKDTKFSFSYYIYVDFEKGAELPSIEALLELAQYFKKDSTEAALLWAKVQMPTSALKKIFAGRTIPRELPSDTEPKSIPPSLDNVWVFGGNERELFEKHPWLSETLSLIVMNYPNEVAYEEFRLPSDVKPQRLRDEYLKHAIESGNLIASEKGLRMQTPHTYIPQTREWFSVRTGNIRRAFEALMKDVTQEKLDHALGFREVVRRPLNAAQAKKWVQKLKKFNDELKSDDFLNDDGPGEDSTYAWVVAFGPQRLKK